MTRREHDGPLGFTISQRAARIRPIAAWRAMLCLHSTLGRQLCRNLLEAPWGTADPVRPYKPADTMSSSADGTGQSGFAQSLQVSQILPSTCRALVGDELLPPDVVNGDVTVGSRLLAREALFP